MGIPFTDPTSMAIESGVQAALDALEPTLSADLFRFSYGPFFAKLLSNPTFYGFPPVVDTTTPCNAVEPVIDGTIDCTGYLSFDGLHFTTQVHRAMTADLAGVLGVPEPSSWALMIAGFGMVGLAARRRHRTVAA
jgi:phospholipase/lecithinase/hemolysin